MKKLVALTLAAMLAFSLSAACAATYTAGQYYTLDYPDGMTLDDASYTADTTDDYIWLYMLYDGTMVVDAALEPATGYEGVSLYEASQTERDAYVQDTLDAYADVNAVYVDEVTSVSGYPFYIYSMEDSDGLYYRAETLIDGTSVNLCAYYRDATVALDEALLNTLMEVLITVRPVDEAATAASET